MNTSKIIAERCEHNPLLTANPQLLWQAQAVFNASVLAERKRTRLIYRAESAPQDYEGVTLNLSTIGTATLDDRLQLVDEQQLFTPSEEWDKFGCEDPRVTQIDGQYLIFYTALAQYHPNAQSIKVGVAISPDLKKITHKHLVTPFNAKAMALFPEKINGQYVAILTLHTDQPPAYIALARFERLEQIWDENYWRNWYQNYRQHILPVARMNTDQVEVGAVPVKTEEGWIFIYAHIQNYSHPESRVFGIEALLLESDDPGHIIGRTEQPFLTPERNYELQGQVKDVIFPSGALIRDDELQLFYGAADSSVAMARIKLAPLLSYLKQSSYLGIPKLNRYPKNPILTPLATQAWRAQAVFNSAAIYHQGRFHLFYRAMSWDNTSTIGYASSQDGFNFDELAAEPVYVPRMNFEKKTSPNGFSGCEDPRVTIIDDKLYMFYTAYDGQHPPQVALTSLKLSDFEQKNWLWSTPVLISHPDVDDKNACLFPEKVNGSYVILHRVAGHEIAIDLVDDLEFINGEQLEKEGAISPREGMWDSAKIGIAGPPIKTEAGWLLIYHGVSQFDHNYRLGYAILDANDPFRIIYRSPYPILEPVEKWETEGIVNNVVFSCGTVIKDDVLYVYYGGADKVVAIATIGLEKLLKPAIRVLSQYLLCRVFKKRILK